MDTKMMNERENFDSIEPSQETTTEGGDQPVSEQSKIEWGGETLSVYEAILRSDQLRSAGKEQEADELLEQVKQLGPLPVGDELPPGETTPLTEEQRRMREELRRADKKFKGRAPHYGPDS